MASGAGHSGGGDAGQPPPTSASSADVQDFINTSDFFNSKGELQLSGVSQFPSESDSNVSTSYDEIDRSQDSSQVRSSKNEEGKGKNTQSGSHNPKSSSKSSDFSITELVEKQANNTANSSSSCSQGKGGKKCKDKKCANKSVSSPPLAQLKSDNFEGFVHMLPKHLQSQMLNQRFTPSSTSSPNRPSLPYNIQNSTQPQYNPVASNPGMSSRTPNFRIKSSDDEIKDPPRGMLSEAEIQQATRKIYEMDRAERESEGQSNPASKLAATPASVIRNLFNASNPTPPHLLPSAESLAIPTLNDGLDELMNYYIHKYKVRPMQPASNSQQQPQLPPDPPTFRPGGGTAAVEVNEPKVIKSKSFVCGDQAKTNEPAGDPVARCLPQRQTQNKNMSPLSKSPKSRAVNLKELDQLWKDIQETKVKMDQDIKARLQQQKNSNVPQLLDAAASPSKDNAPCSSKSIPTLNQPIASRGKQQPRSRGKKQSKKKPKSKLTSASSHAQSTVAGGDNQAAVNAIHPQGAVGFMNPLIQAGLEQSSEFTTLLQMSQLDESTLLEDLLLDDMNDLDYSEFEDYQLPPEDEEVEDGRKETAGDEAGTEDNEEEEEDGDSELSAALQNVQLRDWLRSDPQHVVYYEKYCQEKYKREYCEKEIMDLQKQLLETKEQVAGLDGILQIKTKSGVKYQKLWEGLIKRWKQHEAECASKIDKLEKENTELSKTVESQMTKTKEYEEELSKTVGLVEEFKERMEGMRKQFDAELMEWKYKMGFVQQDLNTVQGYLQQEQKDKECVKQALNQAQDTVEQLEATNKNTNTKLQLTEEQLKSNCLQVEHLSQEKEQLATEVEKEREEKQALASKLRAEFKEDITKEGERLHVYYNEKVREILKSQSEKMRDAEAEFIKAHESEVKNVTEKYEEQTQEMKNHFDNQMSNLKLYYKMEITKLEKESQEKGKLIENVSRELALFHKQDSNSNRRILLPNFNAPTVSNTLPEPLSSRIENNFTSTSVGNGKDSQSSQPQRKRNNSKESNITTANSQTEKSSPNSLRELLESSQGMKESIASLINAYKDKHTQDG